MTEFEELVRHDWLAAFNQYSSYGESSPRLMYWVGVSTLAAAMQRKIWFDQDDYQWSPNFYILIVGSQGTIRKSTSIDVGMRLLQNMEGVDIGPSSATWQAFVQRVSERACLFRMPDGTDYPMSCMTLPASEFGTFFKPDDRELIDVLTELWDGKTGVFEKITKGSGCDLLPNPWINIIAATTPAWVAQNLTMGLLGGGLLSRFIFLHGEMPVKDIAYPKRHMPKDRAEQRAALRVRLAELVMTGGAVDLTEEAYAWGEKWYGCDRDIMRRHGPDNSEGGFMARRQGHLHKLAMVISASRSALPVIELSHLIEAKKQLDALDGDARKVLGVVGQTKITAATHQIVEAVRHAGFVERRKLFCRRFMQSMSSGEFDEAVKSAIQAELIYETDAAINPILAIREVAVKESNNE